MPAFRPSAPVRPLDLVVLANVQLGAPTCRAESLCAYLAGIQPAVLVLNGDLIDLTSKAPLPITHEAVLHALLKLSVEGTRIYYLTGDQDAALQRHRGFSAGNVHLREELVLQFGGRRYWFLHGEGLERLDTAHPTSKRYRRLRLLNHWYRRSVGRIGGKRSGEGSRSFSEQQRTRFEQNALALARAATYDGIICGHTGIPALSKPDRHGIRYANPGNWNRYETSLEVSDGEWQLHRFEHHSCPVLNASSFSLAQLARRPEAQFLQLLGLKLATLG